MVALVRLHVGLSAWIIQDGNYGDFEPGDAEFALEFSGADLHPSGARAPSAKRLTGPMHSVAGVVIAVFDDAWVVDVGVLAFEENPPPSWARAGATFEGETYLGVDPFFYFERLADRPGFPELMYSWRVEEIEVETTPWLTLFESGREIRCRDESRTAYARVAKTDAWHDDGGNAHYVLSAVMVGGPARSFVKRTWK